MKTLNVRLSDERSQKLEAYCADTGRKKTGLINRLIDCLGSEELEKILEKSRYSGSSD